ncbi:hypothetical protein CJ195_19095 [Bacillus sp. UMB0899]|nr:hypothetical protein CJ195_19095 [Bacillus sp. UMB0899]
MTKIQTSNNTFFVDRVVFTDFYPELTGERLRIYLLMCRVVGAKTNGTFYMSVENIAKEVKSSRYYVSQTLEWLTNNFFIKKIRKRNQVNEYKVLVTPDYQPTTNTYYSNEDIPRSRYNLKDTMNGYCELPIEIMKGSILRDQTKWTDRKIKVLGQLYLYHWIDEYGGVDPSAVHYKGNTMFISEMMIYTLNCHLKAIIKVIEGLEREGYLHKVRTIYRTNKNSCNTELQYIGDEGKVNLLPNDVFKDIIRLIYIPSLKLEDAQKRTGGKLAI